MDQILCKVALCGLLSGFVATILVFGRTDESTHVDMSLDTKNAVLLFGAEFEAVDAGGFEKIDIFAPTPDAGTILIRF
jgi:hypothetical protein